MSMQVLRELKHSPPVDGDAVHGDVPQVSEQTGTSQQQLFPRTLSLSPADTVLLKDLLEDINKLGFDIQEFGLNTFIINGIPSELAGKNEETGLVESLIEQYKANIDLKLDIKENVARSMARSAAIKKGQPLTVETMQALIDQLFACEMPFKSPAGKNCFLTFELDELEKRFEG